MKSIADREQLERRARFSQSASLGGMAILLGGVAVSLVAPSVKLLPPILLVGGFGVAVIGIYYANRWVKKPRPEDVLDEGLKALSDGFRLYHYVLPADHVLLTPSGVVVIQTVALEGEFTYDGKRWKERFNMGRALRFFVEEQLGDPIREARSGVQAIRDLIAQSAPDVAVAVDAIVVFTNPNATLILSNPPIPVRQPRKLSKHLPARPEKLADEVYTQVRAALDAAARVERLAV